MRLKLFLIIIFLSFMLFSFRHKIESILTKNYTLWIFKPSTFCSNESDRSLNFRLYSPRTTEAKKYPLVLVLHGGSRKGNDNKTQVLASSARTWIRKKFQEKHPCYVLVPQCPHGGEWVTIRPKSIPFGHYQQDKFPESDQMKLIISLIKKLVLENPIDPNRIYVTGFSMGATGSWDIITRHPDIFAASLVVSGETDPSKASLITHIPIWSFSGENDSIVFPVISQDMAQAVNACGGNVKFDLIPDQGHNIETLIYNRVDVKEWLFSQVRKNN